MSEDQEPTTPSAGGIERWRNGVTGELPNWLKPHLGEPRWAVTLVLAVAIAIQWLLPTEFVLRPREGVPILEICMIVVLVVANPRRITKRSNAVRVVSITLVALIALTNLISTMLLLHTILTHHGVAATKILASGAAIWITNVISFGLWYWEFDRGGPAARASGADAERESSHTPDFLFPQMTDPRFNPLFHPSFIDYLYVSFTNSTAFSPTDTMPMSRWAKVLMAVQSFIALLTVGLVFARAVNILPT